MVIIILVTIFHFHFFHITLCRSEFVNVIVLVNVKYSQPASQPVHIIGGFVHFSVWLLRWLRLYSVGTDHTQSIQTHLSIFCSIRFELTLMNLIYIFQCKISHHYCCWQATKINIKLSSFLSLRDNSMKSVTDNNFTLRIDYWL